MLRQKFDDFMQDLEASDVRVNNVRTMATTLTSSGHNEAKVIEQRSEELSQMWADVKDAAEARKEVRESRHYLFAEGAGIISLHREQELYIYREATIYLTGQLVLLSM